MSWYQAPQSGIYRHQTTLCTCKLNPRKYLMGVKLFDFFLLNSAVDRERDEKGVANLIKQVLCRNVGIDKPVFSCAQ